MIEISPGIYHLKIPIPNNPLGNTNVYLLKGRQNILIDSGINTAEALDSLKEQLTASGVGLNDISQVIATHVHPDHYGLTTRLKELSKAKIALHHRDKELIYSYETDMKELRHRTDEWLHTNGAPPNMLPPFLGIRRLGPIARPDIELQGDEIIDNGTFKLRVIWTPGHSPGHICLYEPNLKILFAGDHILPVITPNISLQPQSEANPLGDFLNSLNKVKDLDCALVAPAHEHIFPNLKKRVEEIIEHHHQRSLEILAATKSESKTAYQLSNEITWMPEFGGVKFKNLAPWERRMAIGETLAHLQAMIVDGRLDRLPKNGIMYYNHNIKGV
ncbi:MAG: MBL fold metallo-hydrolase [Chloroflexota bacterium]